LPISSAVNAFPSAAAYYERVLQLLPDKDSRRLAVVFAHARALFSSGDERCAGPLEQAKGALLAGGEVERAAEVATFLAQVAWVQAQRTVADEQQIGRAHV